MRSSLTLSSAKRPWRPSRQRWKKKSRSFEDELKRLEGGLRSASEDAKSALEGIASVQEKTGDLVSVEGRLNGILDERFAVAKQERSILDERFNAKDATVNRRVDELTKRSEATFTSLNE